MADVLELLQRIGENAGPWLYLIAGGLAFAEAAVLVGMVFPGEVALLVAGFAAHQGWLDLRLMIVIAVGAAALGDSVGYEVGRHLGPRLRASRLGRRIGEDKWRRADEFLRRHGGKAVLLGRFTAILVGMVFPGEVALLVAGFAAHQGWLDLRLMIVIAVGAAALGDSVGYEVGRHLGPRLRASRLGRRIGEDKWRRADDFLGRHGGKAVLLGRFTAILRALTPGIAGAIVWGAGCVLLGYGFSASLTTVDHVLVYVPLAVIVVALLAWVLVRRTRRRMP